MFNEIYNRLLEEIRMNPSGAACGDSISLMTLDNVASHCGDEVVISSIDKVAKEYNLTAPKLVRKDWDYMDIEYVAELLADLSENGVIEESVEVDLEPPIDICCMLGKCWVLEDR